MAQIAWQNPANYKPCRYKIHDCYVCKPPAGVVVINNLMHNDLVKALGSAYFTVEQLAKMNGSPKHNALMAWVQSSDTGVAMTNGNNFVVADPLGNLSVISGGELSANYTFVQDNQPVSISSERLSVRMSSDGTMNWHLVRLSSYILSRSQQMACFVPLKEKIQNGNQYIANGPGLSHGKGDFLVCNKGQNGQPDFASRKVVNGELFALTYNNQGWVDCVANIMPMVSTATLPRLFEPKEVENRNLPAQLANLYKQFKSGVQAGALCSYNTAQSPMISQTIDEESLSNLGSYGVTAEDTIMHIVNVDEQVILLYKRDKDRVVGIFAGGRVAIEFPADNADRIKHYTVLLACLQRKGFMSGFRTIPLSAQEITSFRNFTGNAYTKINGAMSDNSLDGVDFSTWYFMRDMYKALSKCSARGVSLFRGMYLENGDLHAGSIVKLTSFTSWSFSFDTATRFGDMVFCIELSHSVEALYINALSMFRDGEYEVILNAGYHLRVKNKIHTADTDIYFCDIQKDQKYVNKLVERFDIKKEVSNSSLLSGIAQLAETNPAIGRFFYPVFTTGRIAFVNKISPDVDSSSIECHIRKSNNVVRFVKNKNNFDVPISNYDKTIADAEAMLVKLCSDVSFEGTDDIYRFGISFLYNISTKFTREGFQILRQNFQTEKEVGDVMRGTLTISGDNDDHISIRFMINKELSIKFMARTNKVAGQREFDGKKETLVDDVYEAIVKKFALNQHHRVERALNLAARFKHKTVKVVNSEPMSATYDVDGKFITVKYNGNMIVFNEVCSVYYYDNLHTIASQLSMLI